MKAKREDYLVRQVGKTKRPKRTRQQLSSMIAKREGKKSQVTIGNVREIVRIIFQLIGTDTRTRNLFISEISKALRITT